MKNLLRPLLVIFAVLSAVTGLAYPAVMTAVGQTLFRDQANGSLIERNGKVGIVVVARDDGPGIPNVPQALESGFSTSGGLGLGLPGVRRLTDEFDIVSEVGRGTTVTVKKWTR